MREKPLPRSPPEVSESPIARPTLKLGKKIRWKVVLVSTSVLFISWLVAMHFVDLKAAREYRVYGSTRLASDNASRLLFSLYEFEEKYGKFPDASTIASVQRDSGTSVTLSDRTSNDLFAQLLVLNLVTRERTFHTAGESTRFPDEVLTTGSTLLQHGENSYAYIPGSLAQAPDTPVIFAPVIPGTMILDPETFGGKALVVSTDSTRTFLPIDSFGKIILNGRDLFDPLQPFWNGKVPAVKWPK